MNLELHDISKKNYLISIKKCKLLYHFLPIKLERLKTLIKLRIGKYVVKTGIFGAYNEIWCGLSGWQFSNLY